MDLVRHLLQLKRYEMNTRDWPYIRCRHLSPKKKRFVIMFLISAVLYLSPPSHKSLVMHSESICTDSIINRSDYLATNETWMEYSMPVNVLICYYIVILLSADKFQLHHRVAVSSSSSSRKAGRVTI
ncbi:hypothetical protein TNCT_602451 [Trichonephila clavata]|uniref:Uncharacterized protein n=1 Tax=Trichonephila clavata TaxID=2740835 RepID=A0A8X6F6A7_TRICU|nr:hypothetical protein TNCT_602451 [Trichonephila clavata]